MELDLNESDKQNEQQKSFIPMRLPGSVGITIWGCVGNDGQEEQVEQPGEAAQASKEA